MKLLVRFARFWYDFIIGDDWTVAVAVVIAVAVTAILVDNGRPAWPLLPLTVIGMVTVSVVRARRRTEP